MTNEIRCAQDKKYLSTENGITLVKNKIPTKVHDFNNNFGVSRCDASKYKQFTAETAKIFIGPKFVFIWGAGQKGQGFNAALQRNSISVSGFIDSSKLIQGKLVNGLKVYSPEEFFKIFNADNSFVLTASVDKKNIEIGKILETNGFIKDKSWCDIQKFCPFYPTVEITGICNLRCSSCIRSDKEIVPNGRYMRFSDYQLVIDKLIKDIPFLYLVDLYIFGEPILNKDLPKIIKYNKQLGVASGLSTNLNKIDNLRSVMEAGPAQLRVSISGMSTETYDITHTGGKWEKVRENLKVLRNLRREFDEQTTVEFYFHIYKHNLHEIKIAKELCEDYGFRFHPSLAVLFPDFVLNYRKTGLLNQHAQTASNLTILDLDKLIADCDEYSEKNCILTRIVPVINWDMSVMPCCNYTYSKIHPNYLESEFESLINSRTNSIQCADCQKWSLHRWNDQMMYAPFVNNLVDDAILTQTKAG
jgi:MoaA/NifB/PqqE/SkfB family radical SAM enzyme